MYRQKIKMERLKYGCTVKNKDGMLKVWMYRKKIKMER